MKKLFIRDPVIMDEKKKSTSTKHLAPNTSRTLTIDSVTGQRDAQSEQKSSPSPATGEGFSNFNDKEWLSRFFAEKYLNHPEALQQTNTTNNMMIPLFSSPPPITPIYSWLSPRPIMPIYPLLPPRPIMPIYPLLPPRPIIPMYSLLPPRPIIPMYSLLLPPPPPPPPPPPRPIMPIVMRAPKQYSIVPQDLAISPPSSRTESPQSDLPESPPSSPESPQSDLPESPPLSPESPQSDLPESPPLSPESPQSDLPESPPLSPQPRQSEELNCDFPGCHKKGFSKKYTLKRHMKTHSDKNKVYACVEESCGKKFFRKDYLQLHEKTHTGEKSYSCEICGKAYVEKRKRDKHLNVVHSIKFDKNSKKRHKKAHSNKKKKYVCVQEGCGKKFRQNSHLERHQRTHTGEKPYSCGTCEKAYADKRSRDHHLNVVHSIKFDKNSKKRHKKAHSNKKKKYVCVQEGCGKKFRQNSQLERHQQTHTGEKPYSCGTCEKAYADKRSRDHHLNVHSKEFDENSNLTVPEKDNSSSSRKRKSISSSNTRNSANSNSFFSSSTSASSNSMSSSFSTSSDPHSMNPN